MLFQKLVSLMHQYFIYFLSNTIGETQELTVRYNDGEVEEISAGEFIPDKEE